jgi:hypothetical protein
MRNFKWSILFFVSVLFSLTAFQAVGQNIQDNVNIFSGQINQPNLESVVLYGGITYDRNCIPVEGGLTRCDAGVKTNDYGVINFNYTHNMREEPCLMPGNKVLLKVQDSRNAYVIR